MSAVGRSGGPQPSRSLQIDWRNPHTRDLVLATYPEEGNIFRNFVDGKLATEGGGSPAFNAHANTQWGRAKITRGSSYTNRWVLNPLTPVGHRGKMTVLVLCVPRVANGTTTRYVVAGGENTGGWSMARVGSITGDYFIGNCVNGAVLQSDASYTLGNYYALAFTNFATSTPTALGRQRLYVNGVKQAAEGTYSGNSSKSVDYLNIGSALANHWEIYGVFVWARELTANEVAEISANPYQLFAQRPSLLQLAASAPAGPASIAVEAAQAQLVGGVVSMRVSRRLAVHREQMVLSGADIGLRASRKIGLQPAALTVGGNQVGVTAARRLAASAASLLFQLGTVQARVTRRLAVAPVAATLTGGSIQFVYAPAEVGNGYSVPVTPAALALTGGSVTMRVSRKVAASATVLTMVVGETRVLAARGMSVGAAVLQTTAAQAVLRATRRLLVNPAQLVVTGGAVTLSYGSQVEYARAPTGAGYAPAASLVQARPVELKQVRPSQMSGLRPPATQRNRR